MYSPITLTGDGSAPVVNLTFPSISPDHVKATAGGVAVTYTWTGASQITFDAVVAIGVPVVVYRDTPIDNALVDFEDVSVLTAADLDLAATQIRYHQEEISADLASATTVASVAASPLAPGSSPTATVSITPSGLAYSFGLPTGLTGATGPQGADGAQGPQGIQGPAGDQGPQGPQGDEGAQGPQGIQGPAGDQGPQGPQGIQGPAGSILADGTYGDISASGGSLSIVAGAVGLAKMANVAAGTVFYRKTASTGAPEVQTLATLKTDLGLAGTNSGDQTITLTGDLTGSGTGSFATSLANGAVTLAKMANVAAGTVFYRKTASAGAPEVQTLATLKTDLGLTGTNSGDQTITLTGDVTGSGTGSFATSLANGAVTLAKMANVATGTVFYRKTASAGAPEVQTLATLKADLALAKADVGLSNVDNTSDANKRPTIGSISASRSAADSDNNTHLVASGASKTLTLGNLTAGTSFTVRFTTAWSLSCAGGLSKNGASPSGVTTGSVAANSIITFLHEGSGVWVATGGGLT